MGRSSRAVADEHRAEIIDIATRRLKSEGVDGITIPSIMADVGLTPGGFYRHFSSKEDLTLLALDGAFRTQQQKYADIADRHPGDHAGASAEFVERYLSPEHRDRIDLDCPLAALAGDVARTDASSPFRASFIAGLRSIVDSLATIGDQGEATETLRMTAMATLATGLGATILARASEGDAISEEVLEAARATMERIQRVGA